MTEAKPLKYSKIEGFLSEKQLSEHHGVLYKGYVNKIDAIREKLKNADTENANATYSELRELKVEETFAANGVRLHEAYFDSMSEASNEASGKIRELIERDFGSYEAWEKEFKASGMASRGWVVLAYDWEEKRLRNYVCDVHNQGGVWSCSPIIVMDVYEHAYFIDYATGRKSYVEGFMKHVNWEDVNKKLSEMQINA